MFDQYFEKFDLAPEITAALKKCKCIAYAETKAELEEMAYGPTHTSRYDVVYPIEGNSGDSCRQNQYPVGHYEILGYGVPAY